MTKKLLDGNNLNFDKISTTKSLQTKCMIAICTKVSLCNSCALLVIKDNWIWNH